MFAKLESLERKFLDLEQELADPTVFNDQDRYRKLTKAHSDLKPVVDIFRQYRELKQNLADNQELLNDADPDIREMAHEEIKSIEEKLPELEHDLKEFTEAHRSDLGKSKTKVLNFGEIGFRLADQLLRGTSVRARRRHRLIDFVCERRSHAADQREARGVEEHRRHRIHALDLRHERKTPDQRGQQQAQHAYEFLSFHGEPA